MTVQAEAEWSGHRARATWSPQGQGEAEDPLLEPSGSPGGPPLGFCHLASGAGREHISVFSSDPLCGAWFQWPPETDTAATG